MRLLALLALSAVALSGCGGGSETTVTETVGAAAPTTQTDKTTPSGTRSVPSEWTDRWCTVKIGDTREEATAKMGAYPTEEASGKIPLIPYVKIGPDGQNENEGPPTLLGRIHGRQPGPTSSTPSSTRIYGCSSSTSTVPKMNCLAQSFGFTEGLNRRAA
jgi:hypothetical protein